MQTGTVSESAKTDNFSFPLIYTAPVVQIPLLLLAVWQTPEDVASIYSWYDNQYDLHNTI
jgi:hypothetical protein